MTTSDTQLNDTLNRISEKVEAIAGFVGRSAELQLATQHKLDQMAEQSQIQDQKWEQRFERLDQSIEKLGQKLDRMAETMQRQDEKWDRRLDLLTASSERQQASIDRMAASIDRMTASIENTSIRQENVMAGYQKTAQDLIQLATMMMQQKAG
ncbi:MAG: hypothetical protein AAGD25_24800 [Cyanobacteria bacterium P01_F01_bin.150]